MTFKTGDIIRLKDDGDTEYTVMLTSEGKNKKFLKPGFDYLVARNNNKKAAGQYQRYVFEKNVYKI